MPCQSSSSGWGRETTCLWTTVYLGDVRGAGCLPVERIRLGKDDCLRGAWSFNLPDKALAKNVTREPGL